MLKTFEYLYTVIGTIGATLLISSWCLGDVFEMTILGGIAIIVAGGICGAGSMIEERRRDVHFREKMDTLRLKKY